MDRAKSVKYILKNDFLYENVNIFWHEERFLHGDNYFMLNYVNIFIYILIVLFKVKFLEIIDYFLVFLSPCHCIKVFASQILTQEQPFPKVYRLSVLFCSVLFYTTLFIIFLMTKSLFSFMNNCILLPASYNKININHVFRLFS